jgi:hypothetical protein
MRIVRVIALVLAMGPCTSAQQEHPPELDTILQRGAAYVLEYQREFGSAVVEERYVQLAKPWRGEPQLFEQDPALQWDDTGRRRQNPILMSRRLRSDVLLRHMPDGIAVGYRDVLEVDGKPVRDHDERLREIFLSGAPDSREQMNRINRESSRHNLGSARRTVSTPSYPLVYLHPRVRERVKFTMKGTQNIDGVDCSVVEFQERSRPAVVGTLWGADVLARGRFWIELNGRVRRAEVRFDLTAASRGFVRVSYRPEEGLRVLAPRELWEWYQGALAALPPSSVRSNNPGLGGTYLECLATYTNLRRFTVTTSEQLKTP